MVLRDLVGLVFGQPGLRRGGVVLTIDLLLLLAGMARFQRARLVLD